MIRLKHVRTGEVRDVEADSDDLRLLQGEKVDDGHGKSVEGWKVVGEFDRYGGRQQIEEVASVDLSRVGTDAHPERYLTEAEIQAGITSWEQKAYELGIGPKPRSGGESESGYASQTKDELRAVLEERGIQLPAKATKDDLIAALEADNAGEPTETETELGAESEANDTNDDSTEGGEGGDAGQSVQGPLPAA